MLIRNTTVRWFAITSSFNKKLTHIFMANTRPIFLKNELFDEFCSFFSNMKTTNVENINSISPLSTRYRTNASNADVFIFFNRNTKYFRSTIDANFQAPIVLCNFLCLFTLTVSLMYHCIRSKSLVQVA